jgi:hypothetical protein|tara:strand:+ start:3513 stop:3668 length:156 start_codon:yes stop_codon:yes gene_type:complete
LDVWLGDQYQFRKMSESFENLNASDIKKEGGKTWWWRLSGAQEQHFYEWLT